ncbi:hypothetical protein OCC_04143 [Thermococcus litoralis DSM 5473]|uniref:DUF996 domain-containing protein n=1 Tax=Thermococcus litoralis (strain ATCC 51850 / DSM 5473 / JCM 8560 / NS-C) TaxID=523849 RepID=H3ZPH8_THELN|nr:DUF996 domain-containing protein [Thermococcus litoralis]EHR78213.1 hypothetical protein OCC_04143 [Thermococcus litoralis DSM 5473]
MSLKEARTYGSIGAILSLLGGLIPRVGLLVTITGMIMILFAVKEISNEFKREDIFRSYLVALILRLGAFVVLIIAVLFGIGVAAFKGMPFRAMEEGFWALRHVIATFLVGALLAWILFLLGSYYLQKSYEEIAAESGVDVFKTTGSLYFLGAILIIVFGLGVLVIFAGKILEIVAYLSLPERVEDGEG